MVKRIQQIDEYYELSDEDEDDPYALFVAPTYYETDEQLVLIACLMILEQRFRLMQSMTPEQILGELDSIISSLETDLMTTANVQVSSHVQNYLYSLLSDFSIPYQGYVNTDTSMIEIMDDSITALINQLGDEIKVKSKFFKDNLSKDTFNILPNFKRSIQKLIDAVGNNLIYSKEKTKRNVYEFVYGDDKLYYWVTANDDGVCSWCRVQESLPPRTLREMPLDHPRGRCDKIPVDFEYSNEYKLLLSRGIYREDINAFAPEDEFMSQASGRLL